MVDNCSRYGLEGPTGVLSSLGGIKVTECQSALVRILSVVGPDPVIEKFAPLVMTFPLGSSHSTARVDVIGRSGSLLVLHVSV